MNREVQISVRVETGEAQSALERLKRSLGELREGWGNAAQQGGGRAWIQSLADLSAAVNLAQGAFAALSSVAGQFYERAIAQNLELERLVLSSATAIAGTNRVFREGVEITEPIEKIQALTGQVSQAFDYIREQTFKLSGVTSSEVIPLFEVLATQVGNLGGSIQDAADLSVKFAAGLSVIGLPLAQARQEITSILTGTIDINSQLAKTLGITNDQVRQWKLQGTLVEELNARLAAFMAGNELQSQTLAGVTSNIQELVDEFFRLMGAPVVQPLVEGAQRLYGVLLENRELLQEVGSQIGERLGSALSRVVDLAGDVGSKLGDALSDALANFDAARIDQLLADLGTWAEVAVRGLAEVGSWVIRLGGEILPPVVNAVGDLIRLTTEGYQSLIDLAAVLAGGLTGAQVANLDAAQQAAQQFGELVDQVVSGSGVAQESVDEFRAQLERLAAQGALTSEDLEFYNQALARLEEKNRELAASNNETALSLESVQAAADAARESAELYKRAVSESKLAQLQEQLALQEQVNRAELVGAQEVAASRLRIERQTSEAILAAARERLQVLLRDEQANRDAIIQIRTEIAQQELKQAELVQQEREQQYRSEEERVRALSELRQAALTAERAELERRRELIADSVAALEREGQVAAAQASARQAALQSELELAQAAQQRAQGTAQAAEATQRLAQLQAQAAREQAAAQQQELERQRQLIELRHQGAMAALELQQRETAARTASVQAELELLRQRQAIMGALTEQEQARQAALQQELRSLQLAAQTLAENRHQLQEQRDAELTILDLRRQQLQATTAQQAALQQVNQLQAVQRAELEALAAAQARLAEQLRSQIRYGELLNEADRYRAQGIEAQIQALRQQNETLGESQARTQQIQELERQLAGLRAESQARAAELAAQREAMELRTLENQRAQLQLQAQQLQVMVAQLEAAGQTAAAERERLAALQEQIASTNQQIEAQRQVADSARQTAEAVRQAADEAERMGNALQAGARAAEPLTLQFVPLQSATADLRQWAAEFGIQLGALVQPVNQQAQQWQNVVGQLTNAQKLLQFSADSFGIMLGYAQRFGGETQAIERTISQYKGLAREYDRLIEAANRRLQVEQQVIPVLERQQQQVQASTAAAQGQEQLMRAMLQLYDARLQRLQAEGASEQQIAAVLQQREETQRRLQILQVRLNELKAEETVLELRAQLAREQAANADSERVRLLQQQLDIQTELLAVTRETRTEMERTGGQGSAEARAGSVSLSGGSSGVGIPSSRAGSVSLGGGESVGIPGRGNAVRPMAQGGPFRAGELLQVGDNPDGTPNPTTEWIQLSAPGKVLTSGDIKVIRQRFAPVSGNERQKPIDEQPANPGKAWTSLGAKTAGRPFAVVAGGGPAAQWIQASAPGKAWTGGEIKVVNEQPAPTFNDGRIVAGLGRLHDLLRAALSVPAAQSSTGSPAATGYSLREFVLANT